MGKIRKFNKAQSFRESHAPLPGFFSTLDELIATSPRESMTAREWQQYLKPGHRYNREGVQATLTKAELEETEILDLLRARERQFAAGTSEKQVPRDELYKYLEETRPRLVGVIRDTFEEGTGQWADRLEELDEALTPYERSWRTPKHGIAYNQTQIQEPKFEGWGFHHKSADEVDNDGYFEFVTEYLGPKPMSSTQQHFDDRTLVWSRGTRHQMAGASDPAPTVRLIEEVQTDYHQAGRKRGYATDDTADEAADIDDRMGEIQQKLEDEYMITPRNYFDRTGEPFSGRTPAAIAELRAPIQDQLLEYGELLKRKNEIDQRMDPIPFKDTKEYFQHELAKNVIAAIDDGEEYVALVRGADQAKRYQQYLRPEQIEGMKEAYDKIYPGVMRRFANRFGGEPTTAKIKVAEQTFPQLEYFRDHPASSENVDDWLSIGREFVESGDADELDMVLGDLVEIYTELEKTVGRTSTNIKRLKDGEASILQYQQALEEMTEIDIEDLVESGYIREEITPETIQGRIDLNLEEGSAARDDLRRHLIHASEQLRAVEEHWQKQNLLTVEYEKEFPAIRITDEMKRRVKEGGVPLYSKGGKVSKYKRGVKLHEDAMAAAREGDAKSALEMLEELKVILGMTDEELSKMLGSQFSAEPPLPPTNPLDQVYDPDAPVGGYQKDAVPEKLAKGGRPKSPLINAAALFKAKGRDKLDPEVIRHMEEVGFPRPENVTRLEQPLQQESLPPTDEFEDWFAEFQQKLEDRDIAKKKRMAELSYLFKPGETIYSLHSGKKFHVDHLDITKDNKPQYWVTGPDGERHQMAEWGMSGKPVEPKEFRKNREEFEANRAKGQYADPDEYSNIVGLMEDYLDVDEVPMSNIEVVRDPHRPGVFAAYDIDSWDPDYPDDYDGWIIDTNLPEDEGMEMATFSSWPPKTKFAEGGKVEKDRPAKRMLQNLMQSLGGAIPFVGEEASLIGRDVGEHMYDKIGVLPRYTQAGFKTQWWGVDPNTGESVYAGPLSGPPYPDPALATVDADEYRRQLKAFQDYHDQTRAIPGIIDETVALPGLPGMLFGGGPDPETGDIPYVPELSETAFKRMEENEDAILGQMGLDYPTGALQNLAYSGGIMAGQLPVPAAWLNRVKPAVEGATGWLSKLARAPGATGRAGVEFLSPIIEPKMANYLMGTGFGGGLMTGIEALSGTENEQIAEMVRAGDMEAAAELKFRASQGDAEAQQIIEDLIEMYGNQVAMEQYGEAGGGALTEQGLQNWQSGKPYAKGGRAVRGALKQATEGPRQRLYHVTFSENVPDIMDEGLKPQLEKNWRMGHEAGEFYGEADEVFSFDNFTDALSWASKMDWDFNQAMGTGDISIIAHDSMGGWVEDIADPLNQMGSKGRWVKRTEGTEPEDIANVLQVDSDLLKMLSAAFPDEVKKPEGFAKGGGVSRRDVLKGLLGLGTTAAAGIKGATKGDPGEMLETLSKGLEAAPAAKVLTPEQMPGAPWRKMMGYFEEEIEDLYRTQDVVEDYEVKDFQDRMEEYRRIGDLMDEGKEAEAGHIMREVVADWEFDEAIEGLTPEESFRAKRVAAKYNDYLTYDFDELPAVEQAEIRQGMREAWQHRGEDGVDEYVSKWFKEGLDDESWDWEVEIPEYHRLQQQRAAEVHEKIQRRMAEIPDLEEAPGNMRGGWKRRRNRLLKILEDYENLDEDTYLDAADAYEELLEEIGDAGYRTDAWEEIPGQNYAKGGKVSRRDVLKGILGTGATALAGGKAAVKGDPSEMLETLKASVPVQKQVVARTNDWEGWERSATGDTAEEALAKLKRYLLDSGEFESEAQVNRSLQEHPAILSEAADIPPYVDEALVWVRPDLHLDPSVPADDISMDMAQRTLIRRAEEEGVDPEVAMEEFDKWFSWEVDQANKDWREDPRMNLDWDQRTGKYAKGGKVSRRDVLKGIGAAGVAGLSGMKAAVKGDPSSMIEALGPAAKAAPAAVGSKPWNAVFRLKDLSENGQRAVRKWLDMYIENAEQLPGVEMDQASWDELQDWTWMNEQLNETWHPQTLGRAEEHSLENLLDMAYDDLRLDADTLAPDELADLEGIKEALEKLRDPTNTLTPDEWFGRVKSEAVDRPTAFREFQHRLGIPQEEQIQLPLRGSWDDGLTGDEFNRVLQMFGPEGPPPELTMDNWDT